MTQPPPAMPTTEERNWAIAAHLSALVAVMGLPFGHIIGPLVVYLTQKDRSAYVAAHAKASLNFQITVSIAALILIIAVVAAWIPLFAAIGDRDSTMPMWVAAAWFACVAAFVAGAIAILVLIIVAAVAAANDRPYRYPFSIEFVR
jgi:uncharacterized protein